MYIGLHVNYQLFLSHLIKHEYPPAIFEKYSKIKLYENLSNVSRVVPCGRTDITNLMVAYANLRTRLKGNNK